MEIFVNFLATYLIFIFVFLGAYFFVIKKNYLIIFQMIFGVLIAKIIEFILKAAFFIPRPYVVNHQPTFVTVAPIDSSFPSLHTMVAFTLATIIFMKNRRLGLYLFVVAATIGTARIAANVHYPLDIVGGLIMGVTIGISCGKITSYARHHHPSPRSKKSRR